MTPSWVRLALGGALACAIALPTLASDRIEKQLGLESGGNLVVDIEAGSVSVTGSQEPGALVVVTSKSSDIEDKWTLDFEETPGQVRIRAKRKSSGGESSGSSWFSGWFSGWGSSSSLRFDIRVPRKTKISVETAGGGISVTDTEGAAKLQTAGGSIKLLDVSGDATASTAGGSIEVKGLAGRLDAETAGGSVRVAAVSGDARVSTAGGSIFLNRVSGRVDAETAGGSIDADLSSGNRGGRLATMGGSIGLRLDPAASLEIEASSGGGSVSVDLPSFHVTRKTRSSLEGTLGSGGEKLVVETSAGSIRIEGAGAER